MTGPSAPAPAAAGGGDKKKPSNAELKRQAKEDKAARRAAAKAAQPGPGSAADAKGPKARHDAPRHDAQHQHQHHPHHPHPHPHQAFSAPSRPPGAVGGEPAVPECFSHLAMARRGAAAHADKDVHAAVVALGRHMSSFAISDSITRVEATLLALHKVIDSYATPRGTTLSRHLTSHVLNPQIEHLKACRPMCFAMGNAVRWLKLQVSCVDIDLTDADAKAQLCRAVAAFARDRVALADLVIADAAAALVADGDVVVTYARHPLVERALLRARAAGRRFRAVVVDDPHGRPGAALARALAAAAVPVAYAPGLAALRRALAGATLVLAAAEAMFANGAMYARAGTADVAAAAADLGLRFVALCESINFTDRVAVDSLTYNEIDPDRSGPDAFRLLFDTTRDKYISLVITELGNMPPRAAPAVLRKLEEL